MRMTRIRGECPDGRTCPAVHDTDGDVLVIQGNLITDPRVLSELRLGPGEAAVEIPRTLLPEVNADAERDPAG